MLYIVETGRLFSQSAASHSVDAACYILGKLEDFMARFGEHRQTSRCHRQQC